MKKNLPIIIGIIVIIGVAVGIMVAQRNRITPVAPVEDSSTTTPVVIKAIPESTYVPAVNFEGTAFKVVAVNGKLAPGIGDYTVTFTDGKVQAQFCNNVGGEYTIKDFMVTAPALMSTLMFCEKPDGLMNLEQTFGKVLAAGARYTVTGDVLEFRSGDDVMIFQAK